MIFEIYDMQGKRIDSQFMGNNALWTYHANGLNSGVFVIRLKEKDTGKTVATQQIIHIENN